MSVRHRALSVLSALTLLTPVMVAQERTDRADPVRMLQRASATLREGGLDAEAQARLGEALQRVADRLAEERQAARQREVRAREILEGAERSGDELRQRSEQLRRAAEQYKARATQRAQELEEQERALEEQKRSLIEAKRAVERRQIEWREVRARPEEGESADRERVQRVLVVPRSVEREVELETEFGVRRSPPPSGAPAPRRRAVMDPRGAQAPAPDLGAELRQLRRALRQLNARVDRLERGREDRGDARSRPRQDRERPDPQRRRDADAPEPERRRVR